MDMDALRERLKKDDVGTVVATMGTTATGSVDPLPEILALREQYGFRVHCDAAYGGYFGLAENLTEETRRAFDRIRDADSIVIDPHKHGLQPYGCGCVLFRDPSVGRLYKHDSPYTYFSSKELHLGRNQSGVLAAGSGGGGALGHAETLAPGKAGEFAKGLERCREAALEFHRRLVGDQRFVAGFFPELDIVIFAPRADKLSAASALSRKIFEAAAERNLHLAVAELPLEFFGQGTGLSRRSVNLTCLRSVLMKPEHLEWIGKIWEILSESTDEILRQKVDRIRQGANCRPRSRLFHGAGCRLRAGCSEGPASPTECGI